LPATVNFYNWNITRIENMFRLAGQPLGENRRVFQQPKFVRGFVCGCAVVRTHGIEGLLVISDAEVFDEWLGQGRGGAEDSVVV
jgi:hypothetical protein